MKAISTIKNQCNPLYQQARKEKLYEPIKNTEKYLTIQYSLMIKAQKNRNIGERSQLEKVYV